MEMTQKEKSDYSIKSTDGYYIDSIDYNHYENENNKFSVEASYKISSSKYGSYYDVNEDNQNLYLGRINISFYEGEIVFSDVSSITKQTRIEMYYSVISNFDIQNEAVSSLEFPLNQPAFKNITEDMVDIKFDKLMYNNEEVECYKITSDNNDTYGERMNAYLHIKDNIYYVIQIYGGEGKKLDISMFNDFLPTDIVIK